MSKWPSTSAGKVLAALFRTGWTEKRRTGSHRTLQHPDLPDYAWAFHDGVEIGPKMLARIGKATGLEPDDL